MSRFQPLPSTPNPVAGLKGTNSDCDRDPIETFNVECDLIARHYPCRNNSFSKQHLLVRVPFLDPEDRNVNRMRYVHIPRAPAERNVVCYLIVKIARCLEENRR